MLSVGNGGLCRLQITSQNMIYRNRNRIPPKYYSSSIRSRVKCSTSGAIERIRERLISPNLNLEVSPSSYDTAWVAMVPSREGKGKEKEIVPCFPQCLDWIMENQNQDGSWGQNLELIKDSLSCTLACLLALRKWNVGHHLVQKGLEFIGSNQWALSSDSYDQVSPIGFDIIFPMMINYARELDLALPFKDGLLDHMLCNRDSQIKRNQINLGYVAEGMGESFDWKNALKFQRSNGSLFNSPATTAAALIFHCHDDKCFEYLHMLLKEYKSWVPTIYPTQVYTRLCMVDILERLGIDHYFRYEINNILQEIYRLWKEKHVEIIEDISCRALAFRLLRIKGYEVSYDELAYFVDEEEFYKEVSMQTNGVVTVLELYRASQLGICEEEKEAWGKINAWTHTFLKQHLLNETIHDRQLKKQVEYDLKNFYGTLDRVGHRQYLELYDINHCEVLKTVYRCSTINNEDFLQLSRENFNVCQTQHQKELQELERWYEGFRLDTLKQGRDALQIAHFLACAILPDTDFSDARMSYAKTIILVACVDDFFDQYGSRAESLKILQFVKEWNDPSEISYCSQEVEIIFKALYGTVNELAARAFIKQGRCVKQSLINLWAELLTSFMRELDSLSNETAVPTMDEYLSFAWVSIGCKICIFTTIHFLGIKLSEDIIISPECASLCKHVSLVTRLLNDIQTCKREQEENNNLNSVSLQIVDKGISEDEAISNLKEMIEYNRRKLLQLVFRSDQGSIVPRECKDLFWKTCKICHYLYGNGGDEFTSPQEIKEDIKYLMYQPLV